MWWLATDTFILAQFLNPEVKNGFHWAELQVSAQCTIYESSTEFWERIFLCFFQLLRAALPPWSMALLTSPFLSLPPFAQSISPLLSSGLPQPLSYRDTCGYIWSHRKYVGQFSHFMILNLITSANSLLPHTEELTPALVRGDHSAYHSRCSRFICPFGRQSNF